MNKKKSFYLTILIQLFDKVLKDGQNDEGHCEWNGAGFDPTPNVVWIVWHVIWLADCSLTAWRKDNSLNRLIVSCRLNSLNDVHNLLTIHDLPKHRMLTVQPWRGDCRDVKLTAIRIRSLIRHAQKSRSRVIYRHVLILKVLPINRHRAHTVAFKDVASLNRKLINHTMKSRLVEW